MPNTVYTVTGILQFFSINDKPSPYCIYGYIFKGQHFHNIAITGIHGFWHEQNFAFCP